MVVYKEVWIPLIIKQLNLCLICDKRLPSSVGAHCQRSKRHSSLKKQYLRKRYDELITKNLNNYLTSKYLDKLKSYFRISKIKHRFFYRNRITVLVIWGKHDDYISSYYFKLYLKNQNMTVLLFNNAIVDIETNQTQLNAFFPGGK